MERTNSESEQIWARIIGPRDELLKYVEEQEKIYSIRIFLEEPRPDFKHRGLWRAYYKIPISRKEVTSDE